MHKTYIPATGLIKISILSRSEVIGDLDRPLYSMVLSSLFFLDLKGKILISRDYRGDISASHAEEFIELLCEREIALEMLETGGNDTNPNGPNTTSNSVNNIQPPIFHKNGISYCYIKYNNLYCKK